MKDMKNMSDKQLLEYFYQLIGENTTTLNNILPMLLGRMDFNYWKLARTPEINKQNIEEHKEQINEDLQHIEESINSFEYSIDKHRGDIFSYRKSIEDIKQRLGLK